MLWEEGREDEKLVGGWVGGRGKEAHMSQITRARTHTHTHTHTHIHTHTHGRICMGTRPSMWRLKMETCR